MPSPPATWQSLGNCSCYRCCCCPATVYYPPTLNVSMQWVDADGNTSSTSFTLSCQWLACPRGYNNSLGDECGGCIPNTNAPEDGCAGVTDPVMRCHGCEYAIVEDGVPGLAFDEQSYEPSDGTTCWLIPAGVPRVRVGTILQIFGPIGSPARTFIPGDDDDDVFMYIQGFSLFCDCDTGDELDGQHPGIPTYVNPDTGLPCGWRAAMTVWFFPETTIDRQLCYYPLDLRTPAPSTVWFNTFFNGLDGIYPNPPVRIFNPLDPWVSKCCPLRVKFLQGVYEPEYWCDQPNGYWPDASEWPPDPGAPRPIPWNFPIPFCDGGEGGGCGYPYTGTACDCVAPATWDCQRNHGALGYVDITGDAGCTIPEEAATNCLNARQSDDHPDAC